MTSVVQDNKPSKEQPDGRFETTVIKSSLGIGLDLNKCKKTERAKIAKFKEFPG